MKYLHIIEQCKTLPSLLKSGNTVNALLHNATIFMLFFLLGVLTLSLKNSCQIK